MVALSATDRKLTRMYVILAIALVLMFVAALLFVLDRALKAIEKGRRRREAAERLAAAYAYAEDKAKRKKASAEASSALTSVLPAIKKPEGGPRRVA